MARDQATRRVAAILAADAVGYTRLMADNEAATIEALDSSRAVFTEHIDVNQGRVVDTAGDSVMAVFESIEGAALASLAIQKQLAESNEPVPEERRMRFRIGLHLGDIHEKSDGTVYGDGVNVAARLEGLAEPGTIIVSDVVHGALRRHSEFGFADAGVHEVKNVREPVHAYRLLADGEIAPETRASFASPRALVGAAIAIVAVIGIAIWQFSDKPESPSIGVDSEDAAFALNSGPSIAVLPFDNMSGNPEEEYFADGLTEDIITALAHFKDISVIARNSTFQYKDQAVDIRQVGKDLGAKYVLEGSVRRAGDSLRIVAQLIDASNGAHIWAKTFDRGVANVFEVQDEITAQVVGNLTGVTGQISQARLANDVSDPDLEAYDLVLKADANWLPAQTPENHRLAIERIEKAIEIDPDYASAYARLAYYYHVEELWGYKPGGGGLSKSCELAKRAVDLQPSSAYGHHMLAVCHFFQHDLRQFHSATELAVSLNPNDADVIAYLGMLSLYSGKFEQGKQLCERAVYLNPHTPAWYYICLTYYRVRNDQYEQALAYANRANVPGQYWSQLRLAFIYAHLGMIEESQQAFDALYEMNPNFDMWGDHIAWNFNPELTNRMSQAFEMAGRPIEMPAGLSWSQDRGWVNAGS